LGRRDGGTRSCISTSTEVSITAPPVAMAMEPRTAFLDDSAALKDPNDLSAVVSTSQIPDLSDSMPPCCPQRPSAGKRHTAVVRQRARMWC
jgi:hypothetical protein